MGAALVAIGKAPRILLEKGEGAHTRVLVECLSDAGRLISDIHHEESTCRRNLVSVSVDKQLRGTLSNVSVDGWLFGQNLGNRVKAAREMEKLSSNLKPKAVTATLTSSVNFKSLPRVNVKGYRGRPKYSRKTPSFEAKTPRKAPPINERNSSSIQNQSNPSLSKADPLKNTPCATPETFPGSRAIIRQAMINNGIPEEAVEISVSSLAQSSLKQYTNGLKLWWEFCHQHNINCFELNSQAILCFLSRLYDQGRSYSSLNTTRSALSLLISPRVGEDHQIKRFFKGVFKLRPPLPKYHVTWDPAVVLGYLETCYPNNTISLEALTHKLSMLMALVTAHRVQTFSVIEVPNIGIKNRNKSPGKG
ncbi:unnamed protein product [Acanthoscelides obtectus]|uniref:Uncharacterized protein n=1 Tax=Acanthoscelides obtectus TaxID=200917 RepID=A0A9P0M8X0_ACAOB|nr:unnamed protein product [Acanthoscelides obtectus]CAK1621091.1 hypothetical protein AOBTE_LOCUS761 [Acanthoscelides obtectus]